MLERLQLRISGDAATAPSIAPLRPMAAVTAKLEFIIELSQLTGQLLRANSLGPLIAADFVNFSAR